MHRLILNALKGQYVDHINGNKLDNRKCNIRICTQSQNCANVGKLKTRNATSKYKGVYKRRDGRKKCWVAQHKINYKEYYLGSFYTEEEAKDAFNKFVLEHRKEFSKINE